MNQDKLTRVEDCQDALEAAARREDGADIVTECGLTRAELREIVAEMIG